MGTITNTIKTMFTTQGADSTIKDTDNIGRAQTRLGNSSAGNSRQFAAQSKGLGGLVGAYAGAAATTFALQAAFDALSKAASSENIVKGTSALASQIGQSGPGILKSVQDITQGQLTLADAAENANLALSAGFNTTQIESLTKVAANASQALGRDLSDSYTRLIKGSAKLEPELLDELGIFTRIDPAVRAYAKTMNVSTSSLTNFEKRQAFANAVIAEGARKFSAIDVSAPSAQKSLNRLEASISSLSTSFLQIVADSLKPFVDFINNNMGVTLLAFAGIMKIVLAKTGQEMAGWVSGQLGQLAMWSTNLAQQAEKAKGTMNTLGEASKQFAEDVKKRGGLFGGYATDAAGKRTLTGTGSFTQKGAGVTREENTNASAARNRFKEGGAPIGAQRTADIAALKAITDKYNAAVAENTSLTLKQTLAYQDATLILEKYGIAQAAATTKTRLLTFASNMLQLAAKGLTKAFNMLMSAVNYVFLAITVAQLIGTLFDVDILEVIKGYFVDLSQKAEDMRQGFVGLTTAAAGGGDRLTDSLKRVGATDKDLEGVSDKIRDIADSIDAYARASMPRGGRGGSNLAAIITDENRVKGIEAEILKQRGVVEAGAGSIWYNDEDISQAKQTIVILENMKKAVAKYGTALAPAMNQISRSSGMDVDIVSKIFGDNNNGLITFDKASQSLKVMGKDIELANGGFYKLTEKERAFIDSSGLLVNVLEEADKGFSSGTANSEKLSEQLAGAKDQFNKVRASGLATADALQTAADKISNLTKEVRDLKTMEDVLSGIQSTFSGQIGTVDKAGMSGFVSMSGKLAQTSKEAKDNQIAYLGATVQAAKNLGDENGRMGAAVRTDSIRATLIEAGATASKALTGQLLEQMQVTQQIITDEKQKTIELTSQLRLLRMQNDIALASARFQLSQTETANTIANSEHQLELSKVGLTNLQATHGLEQQRIKNNNELLDITAQIANTKGSGNAAQDKAQLEAIKNQTKLNAAAYDLTRMERDVTMTRRDLEAKKKANLELEKKVLEDNYKNQIAAIKASGGGQAAATKAQIDSLNRQAELIDKQKGDKKLENYLAKAQFDKETAIMRAKIQADIAKADNDSKTIEATRLLDLARVNADEASNTAQNKAILAQLDGFDEFNNSVVGLVGGIDVFARTVAELVGVFDATGNAKAAVLDTVKNLPQTAMADTSTARGLLASNMELQANFYKAQRGQINDIAVINQQNYVATRQGLIDNLAYTDNLRAAQKAGLITQQQADLMQYDFDKKKIEKEKELARAQLTASGSGTASQLAQAKATFDQAMQDLANKEEDLAYASSRIGDILLSIKGSIASGVTSALDDLNSSLFDTSDTVTSFGDRIKNAFFNIMKGIQEEVFKQTISNPIGTFVADFVGKNILGKIADATVTGAAAQETAANAAALIIPASGAKLAAATATSSGEVALANTAGATTLMSSLGPILAVLAVIAAIIGIFGGGKKSRGGSTKRSVLDAANSPNVVSSNTSLGSVPQMASGGMLRDRTPALLEPGEFVIRKPIARKIGASNLAAMNATGKGHAPATTVNIKNEGTQKDASASAPRFDGDKYVIDIIMRDLSTNGPIRRTLRGGV